MTTSIKFIISNSINIQHVHNTQLHAHTHTRAHGQTHARTHTTHACTHTHNARTHTHAHTTHTHHTHTLSRHTGNNPVLLFLTPSCQPDNQECLPAGDNLSPGPSADHQCHPLHIPHMDEYEYNRRTKIVTQVTTGHYHIRETTLLVSS